MQMRLLLIEDDDYLRSEIRESLVRRRHEVTAVASASEARRVLDPLLASGESFDAVVCDMNLADGDGIDLYVEFGSQLPARRWILMSGNPDPERVADERRKQPALPPCTVVQKPVSLRQLAAHLTGD
jgi:DNA-binding NtrC family response regulator